MGAISPEKGVDNGCNSKYIYLEYHKSIVNEKIAMPGKRNVERLLARYEGLKASVSGLGLVQIGSVAERIDRRANAKGEMREWGPYYQWTFKEAGKTRTVNLTREQARVWAKAILNHRKLEKIVDEMRSVSLRILRETTQGVPPRQSAAGNKG
jgi:hypothetical protein